MIIIAKRAVVAASTSCALLLRKSSSTTAVRPASINLLKASPASPSFKGLELEYGHGEKFLFSAEFLRIYSPAADSTRIMASGKRKIISGRRHVHILGIEPVGKYGIRILYDDTHDTGIYTWTYLHDLGSKKFYYMRQYIKSLWEQGLSREPRKKNGEEQLGYGADKTCVSALGDMETIHDVMSELKGTFSSRSKGSHYH